MRSLAILSPMGAWLTFTLSESSLFAPVRTALARLNPLLGKLVSCGYCVSFWVSLVLVSVYRLRLLPDRWWALDLPATVLGLAWLIAIQWAAIRWLIAKGV